MLYNVYVYTAEKKNVLLIIFSLHLILQSIYATVSISKVSIYNKVYVLFLMLRKSEQLLMGRLTNKRDIIFLHFWLEFWVCYDKLKEAFTENICFVWVSSTYNNWKVTKQKFALVAVKIMKGLEDQGGAECNFNTTMHLFFFPHNSGSTK